MIQDRGTKKWTSIMMPEQIQLLREWHEEQEKVTKPILGEDEIAEVNDLLVLGLQDQVPLILKLWVNGFVEEVGPLITTKIDPYQRVIYGDIQGETKRISFDSLIGARTP